MLRRAARPWDQRRLDAAVLLALLAIAAVLRFVDLPTRGTWDADQGNDMLVLRGLVLDGRLPLLGPPTSIGDFHHGVLYYYLLAPAAWLTAADPTGVVAAIALSGVAAVAVTWWLARSIGGPIAGAAAGFMMAVSASAVDESTFIWNPNLIALTSSVALAGAWRAWTTRRPGWWVLAGLGTIATMHCHVLGIAMLPVTAGLLIADARRRAGSERTAVARVAGLNVALLGLSYVPLAVHELSSDFLETRAAVDFITGGEGSATALPVRFLIVAIRVLAWPLTGLITDAPAAALIATGLVIAIVVWRTRAERGDERTAVRWLGLALLWSTVALTFAASGLATVIPGLPNDHYHAFADPMVFVLVGLGVAALAGIRQPGGALAAAALVVVLAGYNLANQPPARARDGGWPAARDAAERILASTRDRPIALESLPEFKPATAVRFPLAQRTSGPLDAAASDPRSAVVVLCDDLFRTAIGAKCGGEAEALLAMLAGREPADRFEAAPGRWVSVYLPD